MRTQGAHSREREGAFEKKKKKRERGWLPREPGDVKLYRPHM